MVPGVVLGTFPRERHKGIRNDNEIFGFKQQIGF